MIEMTIIDAHRVIRSGAGAGELNNTVLVWDIRCARSEGKTSNTALLSGCKAKLKQTGLGGISRRIVENDGIIRYARSGRTSPGNGCLTFNCDPDRNIYSARPICRAAGKGTSVRHDNGVTISRLKYCCGNV
jgi:hypothetical protein